MFHFKYSKIKSICILMLICAFGCKSNPKPVYSNLSIGKLTWVIEKLDPSIWPEPLENGGNMFISFSLEYSGSFKENDIKKLVVESPSDYWIVDGKDLDKFIDYNKTHIIFNRLQCGTGNGKVALGDWTVTLIMKNSSEKIQKKINIMGFESSDYDKEEKEKIAEDIKYIVPKASGKNEISALSTPVIKSISRDNDTIEIFFSISDSRVKNGYFWFDVPGEKYYKDAGSMIDASGVPVNGCRKFSVDGKDCHLVLRKDKDNEEWFDSATACYFVVSDTNRVADPWEEKIRSVSAKMVIN